MADFIDADELFLDCVSGLVTYGVPQGRAETLAKVNTLYVLEEMYEAQDTALQDIAAREKHQRKKQTIE